MTSLELARVREMTLCDWRLRRLTEMERGLFTLALQSATEADAEQQRLWGRTPAERDEAETLAHAFRRSMAQQPALTLLRYQAQLQRSQERARKALKQLQAELQQQEAEDRAAAPNEPKLVIPIWPAPSISPNEPEPAPAPPADQLPNEPKPTVVQTQQDRTRPPK